MARWTASAKWGEAPALDGQCATLLALRLSEGLGRTRAGGSPFMASAYATVLGEYGYLRIGKFLAHTIKSQAAPSVFGGASLNRDGWTGYCCEVPDMPAPKAPEYRTC